MGTKNVEVIEMLLIPSLLIYNYEQGRRNQHNQREIASKGIELSFWPTNLPRHTLALVAAAPASKNSNENSIIVDYG